MDEFEDDGLDDVWQAELAAERALEYDEQAWQENENDRWAFG